LISISSNGGWRMKPLSRDENVLLIFAGLWLCSMSGSGITCWKLIAAAHSENSAWLSGYGRRGHFQLPWMRILAPRAARRFSAQGVREGDGKELLISRKRKARRVLHVIDSLDLGGAQVVLLNLIRHADVQRYEIDAACLHGRGVYWRRLAGRRSSHALAFFSPLHADVCAGLLWLMLMRRYDVVHAHLLASNVIAKPLAALCQGAGADQSRPLQRQVNGSAELGSRRRTS
jgi:hypothetical protein